MRDGITKRLWLYLYREGGHHTPAQIAAQVCDTYTAAYLCTAMYRKGYLKRYPIPGKKRHTYGVTKGCFIPQGITPADLGL